MAATANSPTVGEIEQFIKRTLASEDIRVTQKGYNTIELVVTDPNADLAYSFGQLNTCYGATITESSLDSARGTYLLKIPDSLNTVAPTQSSGMLHALVYSVSVAMTAIMIARFCYTLDWRLLLPDPNAPPPDAPPL